MGSGVWGVDTLSSLSSAPYGSGQACFLGEWLTFSLYPSDSWERILVFPFPTTFGE